MCGRYTLTRGEQIRWRFGIEEFSETQIGPRYNVCPEQTMPVIVREETNQLEMMRWGLVPFWSKEPKSLAINARIEGVLTKPSFRKPIRSQRCLIPATGFYEWKKEGAEKTPFYILRKDGELFAFAGIYDEWHGGGAETLKTFAIITTAPNELLSQVHNRMPLILQSDQESPWLTTAAAKIDSLLESLKPVPLEQMEMFPVSKMVN
jgi:putative SOS response-associated peptidase YedK